MEMIFKSEQALKRIEKVRAFLLSEKWMAVLFCLAGVFTTLGAFFPEKNVEAIGTIVFGYILGFTICQFYDTRQVIYTLI